MWIMRALLRASIALVPLVACGPSPRSPDLVVFASGSDLESANPLVTIHSLSRQVQRFVLFTTLAQYDSALEPAPYLAQRWVWSKDRRELTFAITSRLRWHDGRPTTSGDVAFTLLAAADPKTGYPRAGDLAAIDTVLAPDDTTAIVRFSVAQPRFPLVFCELPILPAHLLAGVPRGDMRRADFNLAPIGNGPFRFVERRAGQHWRFARDSTFPVELGGPARIRELVIAVVDEATTKLAGLASGDLDFAGIAPSTAELAKRDRTLVVMDYPIVFVTGLVFNSHRPPFDDVRVRRAIGLSLDRDRMIQASLAGYGRAAAGPVPPESPWAGNEKPPHDTRLADSLLDAGGWRRSAGEEWRRRDGKTLTIELLSVGSGETGIEQLIQSDLSARGIQVELRNLELATLLARARATPKDFDILLTGIPGDVSLAYLGAMYDSRQRGGALDYGDFHTPRLDSLFAATRVAPTSKALAEAWRAVQEELAEQVPAVWIYHARGVQGVSRRMRNVVFDLRGELASVRKWEITR
jgi:peptide/nickel transport system substrate-binding protein